MVFGTCQSHLKRGAVVASNWWMLTSLSEEKSVEYSRDPSRLFLCLVEVVDPGSGDHTSFVLVCKGHWGGLDGVTLATDIVPCA